MVEAGFLILQLQCEVMFFIKLCSMLMCLLQKNCKSAFSTVHRFRMCPEIATGYIIWRKKNHYAVLILIFCQRLWNFCPVFKLHYAMWSFQLSMLYVFPPNESITTFFVLQRHANICFFVCFLQFHCLIPTCKNDHWSRPAFGWSVNPNCVCFKGNWHNT